jgi:hypothetical protein
MGSASTDPISGRFDRSHSPLEESVKTAIRLLLLAGSLALWPSAQALAACGVGTTIWEGNDSTGAKVLAFTTNVWTLKGISTTFEIAGCTEQDNIFKRASSDAKIRHFAGKNLDHLAADMARGSGEHLDAFAHVIELEERDLEAFRRLTHDRFEDLFARDHTTSDEMLEVLGRLMAEHETLAVYVES